MAQRKVKAQPAGTGKKSGHSDWQGTSRPEVIHLVSGEGTEEEVWARCEAGIPGFSEWTEKVKGEVVRPTRLFWSMPQSLRSSVHYGDNGAISIGVRIGANGTLNALRQSETFASASIGLCNQMTGQLAAQARAEGGLDEDTLDAAHAFVRGGGATDTVQSALLVQMNATHTSALSALRKATAAATVEQAQVFGNLSTKLLNLYARQAETLAKIQRDGTQTVKHVHIDNRHGGQAVVTDQVITKGGMPSNVSEQPYEQGAFGSEMLSYDAQGNGVPIACQSGAEAMQAARGSAGIGRTAGE